MATYRIVGQVIYAGPTIAQAGLHYGTIFRNGIHENLYNVIAACPAVGAFFVPVKEFAAVRRQLNFDIARNMRGTTGKYVEFYRAVQNWLAQAAKADQTPKPKGVKVKHHA
jgi:hypothetical protein